MLGVEFVRRHTFDAIGVTWSDVLCSSSAATVVSGYDPDSDDQVYMTTLIHETLHTLGVDHTEDWIQMKNKNLIKKGKKPNFTCGVNDLMSAYENGSHKVNKCTIEQLALFLGKYENKKQCLKASPFNPNAASVNPLLTGITKNESSGSNNSKSGGNPPPVVPGKNNVKKPDIIPNQTSEVSTTVSSPPLVSTTVSRPPLVSTTVSRPPLVSTTVSSPPLVSTTVSSPPLESTTVSGPPLESTVVSSPPLESTVVSTSLIVSTTDVSTSFSSPPILSTTTEILK
ncbi:hypothetical protein HMI55_005257 [Coelomomyces lativittatus]|nr:hypothetical protein HMI55_005257 [Coelomomyces lativittatus]